MFDKLRAEAFALIVATPYCILSTMGPAGVQASMVSCVVCDERIYVLIPSTADHLFNLEFEHEILLTTPRWQLRGGALIASELSGLHGPIPHTLGTRARLASQRVVEIFPIRMQIEPTGAHPQRTTIDFDAAGA